MIAALWHRWFDTREYRRALRISQQNYRDCLIKLAGERQLNRRLRRANARLVAALAEKEHR